MFCGHFIYHVNSRFYGSFHTPHNEDVSFLCYISPTFTPFTLNILKHNWVLFFLLVKINCVWQAISDDCLPPPRWSDTSSWSKISENISSSQVRIKVIFQFEIIINVLVSSFRFIWIPMLRVHHHYKYLTLSVRGSIYNWTSTDVRFWDRL